jgi:NTP pyrophosphatase (non-canonical NTP hydrolase)
MIDENKLLEEVQKRINYWDAKAAECDEAGYLENMDICDGKAMEMREVVNFIKELQNMTDDIEKNPKKEKLKKIADHYGLQAQKGMLIEEMAELMQAVNRFDRNTTEKNLDAIAEEIADVEIMIAQAKYLYVIPQEKIDEITDYKIQRTLERMEVDQ